MVSECQNFLYIGTTGFTTKTGHRQKKIGSLIQKSRETAARTGPNRMGGAFHHTNDECEGSVRSAILHAVLHNTGMLPSYKQTLHAWLLTTNRPTVQTPCKNSIALRNASLAVTSSSDATFMLPAGGALFVITEALFVIRIHVFYRILPVFYPYSTHFPKLTVFYRIHQERTRIHKNTQEYEHVEEGERHILRK